jgi:hypothetical protein
VPDPLLNLLKIFLLVLLYLFFARVLRAVWAEINPPKTPRPASAGAGGGAVPAMGAPAPQRGGFRGARSGPPHLKAIEPPPLRGQTYMLDTEVTLGRAAGCQVPLDDAYASQVHARVFQREGQWYIEDLGSTNGTYLNRRRVAGPMVMNRRDRIQIGNTVLELA